MSQGFRGLLGSQEEWRPELRFARRRTTKREWNFVHNLDTIASSCISTSKSQKRSAIDDHSDPQTPKKQKISPRAECIMTSPPHFRHPGSVHKKQNTEPAVTSSPLGLQLPSDGISADDEHTEEDEFDVGGAGDEFDVGGGDARAAIHKDLSIAADKHPAAADFNLSHDDRSSKNNAETKRKDSPDHVFISQNSKRSTRSSQMKRSTSKFVNEVENGPAIEITENTASQQSSITRQRLTSSRADDNTCTSSMFNKEVSLSIMSSTPKPGKAQISRKKMVSLSQYQMSISQQTEEMEEEEKRRQEPSQNTQIAQKQTYGNKFYRTISTQDAELESHKSSTKIRSDSSKQGSSKKMEALRVDEMKENCKYSFRQSSHRKRLRSDISDKSHNEAENSQVFLKEGSQSKRLKSVSANEKKIVAVKLQVPDQQKSIKRGKRLLSVDEDDVEKGAASKQNKKGIFSVQPISPAYSQNVTQSTPIAWKYNKEHEGVELKQQDKRVKKKSVSMKNSDSGVGACTIYMWNTGEMKRGSKDITDFDVALDCIMKTLECERDLCASKPQKKALAYLQTYMKKEIRDMIRKHHDVQNIKSSIKKKNAQILHLRKELLAIQKKRFKQSGDLAKGNRDNSARNAQKISHCLAQIQAFIKETPSFENHMERRNSRISIQQKMAAVGYFPTVT